MTIKAKIYGWSRSGQLDGLLQILTVRPMMLCALLPSLPCKKLRQCAGAACYDKERGFHSPNQVLRSNTTSIDPSRVGAAHKVSPNWSQETITFHSSNCFSIVWGQGNAPLVTYLPSSCYMTRVNSRVIY